MLSFVICDIYNNSLGLLSAGSNGLLTCTRLHIWHSGWFLVSFSRAIFVFCIVPPFWFCYDRRSLVCELPNCMMMGQDMHELIMLWWADLFICQGENSFEMEEGVGDSDGNLLFCPWITMKRASKVYLHPPVCMYVCVMGEKFGAVVFDLSHKICCIKGYFPRQSSLWIWKSKLEYEQNM